MITITYQFIMPKYKDITRSDRCPIQYILSVIFGVQVWPPQDFGPLGQ